MSRPASPDRDSAASPQPTTTLVTCHSNADFDAYAAMLAAARLYAPCDLIYPGSQEKNLNRLHEEIGASAGELVPGCRFVDMQGLDFSPYEQLIVVDTRQRSRLRHVWPLLDNPGIRVEAWDHHPDTSDDIHPHLTHFSTVGAVTTLLVFRLKEKGFTLPAKTATVLGMGLYSDTGSFSYSSTTGEDLEAAAWLMRQGMDTNAISDQLAFEMTRTHVQALNSLLESAQTYTFSGEQVVLAETTLEHYLGDFAYLAHKLMEMEKFPVLFAIGRMDDRIQVVARSRFSSINVGDICRALGGGGHVYAASASIRDKSLTQVRDALLNALYMQQSGDRKAQDYMSSPAVGLETGRSVGEADELMLHFGLKAVPVFAKGTRKCVGIMDGETAQKARGHGLADLRVDEYMHRPVICLPPDASLKELTSVIVGRRQRLVPIVRDEEVIGVVTRTDLIGIFAAEPGRMDAPADGDPRGLEAKTRHMAKALQDQLPKATFRLLQLVAALGREIDMPVYVVGGFVRDLLLKVPNQDIDLVVEGDGMAFAQALAQRLDGRTRMHRKFLTACVVYHDAEGREQRVDVATARLEFYESPASMPTVKLSSIKMDLYRRDFTINALALRLDCEPMGQIVDFFGGQQDMRSRTIRVLHTLSFVEDPTRMLRAARFEQRYQFRIGADTEKLIRNALSLRLLDKLSPARVFHEFETICDEEHPILVLMRLNELGVLQNLHPQLSVGGAREKSLMRAAKVMGWYKLLYLDERTRNWFVYFLALVGPLSYSDALICFRKLGLPEACKTLVMQGREKARYVRPALRKMFAKGAQPKPSAVCALLRDLPTECLLWVLAEENTPEIRRTLSRYITSWRSMTPDLNGSDLMKMGLPSGPACGLILRRLLTAKLDHQADTPARQFMLARELVRQALDGTLEDDRPPRGRDAQAAKDRGKEEAEAGTDEKGGESEADARAEAGSGANAEAEAKAAAAASAASSSASAAAAGAKAEAEAEAVSSSSASSSASAAASAESSAAAGSDAEAGSRAKGN
ncbi:MAG: CBS domain-containing protein [Desulfovibrionaceae bacterium]|nr:CBS domain-containing protein [Desulfovibrionaceae bacterium]